jgi:hypothetical protein
MAKLKIVSMMKNNQWKTWKPEAFRCLTARDRLTIFVGSIVSTRSRELYGETEG